MGDNNFMNDDFEFEKMMQEKMKDNFGSQDNLANTGSAGDERLKEMNKKLPSWNLEPPFSFLK